MVQFFLFRCGASPQVKDPLVGTLQQPRASGQLRDALTAARQAAAANGWSAPKGASKASARPGTGTAQAKGSEASGVSISPLPAKSSQQAALAMHDRLLDFERKQHQKMNFQV
jgi:hypothetical protein